MPAGGYRLDYTDGNYAERTGWKEIVLAPEAGVHVSGAGFSLSDRTDALTRYPDLTTTAPPQDVVAHMTVEAPGSGYPLGGGWVLILRVEINVDVQGDGAGYATAAAAGSVPVADGGSTSCSLSQTH